MEIALLLLVVGAGWFWYDGMRARELAHTLGKRACTEQGLQFLDDTVAMSSIKVKRDEDGQLTLQRVYRFEFSDTGDNRRGGSIAISGQRITALQLEPYRLH